MTVAYVLDPVEPGAFLSEYYEKKPLHVRRAIPGYFSRWLTVESFVEVLRRVDPEVLRLKSVKDDVAEAPVTLQRAMDAFHGGATIVANHLHLVHGPVAELCRELEMFFWHTFQTNIYFTPSGNRGFGLHFDVHDVFVMQIQGRKRWKIYAPEIELPLLEQQGPVRPGVTRVPLIDEIIEPGDLLYMPRGYLHEAAAVDDGVSLHMSLGMIALTWRDLLVKAVQDVADRDVALRRAVGLGPRFDGAAGLEPALEAVLRHVREEAVTAAHERFVLSRAAIAPQFALGAPALDESSVLRRDPLVMCRSVRKIDHVALSFQGKGLEFPLEIAEMIDWLVEQEQPFTVRDIPGNLDDRNKLRLLSYLREQGLLRTGE